MFVSNPCLLFPEVCNQTNEGDPFSMLPTWLSLQVPRQLQISPELNFWVYKNKISQGQSFEAKIPKTKTEPRNTRKMVFSYVRPFSTHLQSNQVL